MAQLVKFNNKLLQPSYLINRFDFYTLFTQGKKKNGQLIVNKSLMKIAEILEGGKSDLKGNCQAFDQFFKAHPDVERTEEALCQIFINIDFNDFVNHNNDVSEALKQIPNGIVFDFGDYEITYVDFLKSNSMSKHKRVFFIDQSYMDFARERLTFKFDDENNEVCIPKFYAYSGLVLSDTNILPNIHFDKDEIVVIPDLEDKTGAKNIITAISVKLLISRIEKLNELLDNPEANQEAIEEIKEEFIAYRDSKEFNEFISKEEDANNVKLFKRENQKKMAELIEKTLFWFGSNNESLKRFTSEIVDTELDNFIQYLKDQEIFVEGTYWQKISVNLPTKINHFDGEGLISKDFVEHEIYHEINRVQNTLDQHYKFGHSFQIRLPFIKGVVHSCDFKTFFLERGIDKIVGLTYNKAQPTKEYDISKVKMILTESQFKAAKLFKSSNIYEGEASKFDKFIETIRSFDYSLGVSFELGLSTISNSVKLNYQFLSTIPFASEDIENIVKDNVASFSKKCENDALIESIKNDTSGYYNQDKKFLETNHEDFYVKTDHFINNKKKIITSLKNDLYRMQLDYPGFRKYNSGDLLELLYFACYHQDLDTFKKEFAPQMMGEDEFYAPHTDLRDTSKPFLLLRNPHYSKLEIGILRSFDELHPSERKRFFGHITGTVMVNSYSCTPDRLGGSDMDGDQIVILNHTDSDLYLEDEELKKMNDRPFIKIPSTLASRKPFTYKNRVESLNDTFSSRVGLISNNAITKMFELNEKGDLTDKNDEIALYTIICGLEIDSVKNGLKPYILTNQSSNAANFFIKLKSRISGERSVNNKDKAKFESFENINNIFKVGVALKSLDKVKINAKTRLSPICRKGNTNQDDINKIITAHLIYRKLNYNVKDLDSASDIYNNIVKICTDIEDVDALIDSFNTSDNESLIQKYCRDDGTKFHFLTKKEDKIEFIKDLYGEQFKSIDEADINRVCDFSNNGVYLLYYILMYNYYLDLNENVIDDSIIKIDDEEILDDGVNAEIEFLSDHVLHLTDDEKENLQSCVYLEIEEVNDSIYDIRENGKKIETVKEQLREYLKDVDLNNYLYFLDHNSDRRNSLKGNIGNTFTFDILLDNLIDYLNKGGAY